MGLSMTIYVGCVPKQRKLPNRGGGSSHDLFAGSDIIYRKYVMNVFTLGPA